MNNITIKKITDIEEARSIWSTLSPDETIYQNWNFRYLFNQILNYPIVFFVIYESDSPISLLPLEFNIDKKCLQFFGGNYAEDNEIFSKNGFEKYEKTLLDEIFSGEENYSLEYMKKDYQDSVYLDDVFYLPLNDFEEKTDFIEKNFQGKHKQNLRAQLRKLDQLNIKIKYNQFVDLDEMIAKNINRFGSESTFNSEQKVEYIKELIKNFDSYLISIYINNNLESVGLSLKYKDIYYGFNSGSNNQFNGLGKYLILEKIDQAIKSGAKEYNARAGSLGWKESFHLHKRPQYAISNLS